MVLEINSLLRLGHASGSYSIDQHTANTPSIYKNIRALVPLGCLLNIYGNMDNGNMKLPPGFLFDPTDEELILHFLCRRTCHPSIIPEIDLQAFDPWELDGKALSSCMQWYFYTQMTQNRATKSGYWKEVGINEAIFACTSGASQKIIGSKSYFIFCIGEPPGGTQTSWIMHQYRINSEFRQSRDQAVCSNDTPHWLFYCFVGSGEGQVH
ncbi:hypothetical protein Ancab_002917 [Ancistrocladus abbreviatus]